MEKSQGIREERPYPEAESEDQLRANELWLRIRVGRLRTEDAELAAAIARMKPEEVDHLAREHQERLEWRKRQDRAPRWRMFLIVAGTLLAIVAGEWLIGEMSCSNQDFATMAEADACYAAEYESRTADQWPE